MNRPTASTDAFRDVVGLLPVKSDVNGAIPQPANGLSLIRYTSVSHTIKTAVAYMPNQLRIFSKATTVAVVCMLNSSGWDCAVLNTS